MRICRGLVRGASAARHLALLLVALCLSAPTVTYAQADTAEYRQWITEMKEAARGPFRRLRWFCNDGTILPPKPYACRDHGGGYQHGQWSDRTVELREQGYFVANLFAGIEPEELVASEGFDDLFAQILVERYLIAADNGWIFRRALFYRGAIQEENERAGGRDLLEHLARQERWTTTRFGALRAGVSLIPHGGESASAQAIRQESAALAGEDERFAALRAKIHGSPDAGDADRVRRYARDVEDRELARRYEALAQSIDALYAADPIENVLDQAAEEFARYDAVRAALQQASASLRDDPTAANRYRVTAGLLAAIRDLLDTVGRGSHRIDLLDLSLAIEAENFRASVELRPELPGMARERRLDLMAVAADAAYGVGLLKQRERDALVARVAGLATDSVSLDRYMASLRYLSRVPAWGSQNLRFLFFESMQKLAQIEPKAILFVQDQLRGSPLLAFSDNLDGLLQDANRAAGVRHRAFGEEIGVGFNALNPGIAVGTLHVTADPEDVRAGGIYVLPETVSDLPPVAGILTAGEGNPLSHVQLLARNLGIPNVAVNESLLPRLRRHDGEEIVFAVSPAGLVELSAYDRTWRERLGQDDGAGADIVIRPDLAKLDLSPQRFFDLDALRAEDSGRTVGPKAAKLGELKHAFPEAVAPGLAIPFGLFKSEVLDQPSGEGDATLFDWMVDGYRALERLAPGPDREQRTEAFRAELYQRIIATQPSDAFREALRTALRETFGSLDTGLFVRSDTNVEDLPGFTGAGLNLTLPNVVGFDRLIEGIVRVWASPFTARAFAWRQTHMEQPEHVYTSILLLEAVASDKSGVMVTQDLETGARNVISVAVNEGLGGAVDGQAAESLRIHLDSGEVSLLATATAPWRRRPAPGGGIDKLPATGADRVLQPAEIERLIRFARDELPRRFPAITDDDGSPAAADVEFGFEDGELRLFQIRPFLENRGARGNSYLVSLDKSLADGLDQQISLEEVAGR